MRYYFIGIGGTGAKCLEALIHLCSAGFMPTRDELHVFFVDADEGNAMLDRARRTLGKYRECQALGVGKTELFKTRITTPHDTQATLSDNWSPYERDRPTLSDLFSYANLSVTDKGAADLFDVLYGEGEKTTPLDKGFRGHPSIGAAVLTHKMSADLPFWEALFNRIKNDMQMDEVRVFLVGSIFGGTGAAGFPVIGRLIRERFPKGGKVHVGGLLMLPYFQFQAAQGFDELHAYSEDFLLNTQAALRYYDNQKYDDYFDRIYLVGDNSLSKVEFSTGGATQLNPAHLVEFYAGMAAVDFFTGGASGWFPIVARRDEDGIAWEDVPGGPQSKDKLSQFARFVYAYRRLFHPTIKANQESHAKSIHAPWLVDLIEKKGVNIADSKISGEIESLLEYGSLAEEWWKGVEESRESFTVSLLDHAVLSDPTDDSAKLHRLVVPPSTRATSSSKGVWERICECSLPAKEDVGGFGCFVRALYDACENRGDR